MGTLSSLIAWPMACPSLTIKRHEPDARTRSVRKRGPKRLRNVLGFTIKQHYDSKECFQIATDPSYFYRSSAKSAGARPEEAGAEVGREGTPPLSKRRLASLTNIAHALAFHPPHRRNPRANPTAPSSRRTTPPPPSSLPTPFPAAARARLPPPPQPGCTAHATRALPPPDRRSPPGPRACPSGPKGPRDAEPGRPRPPWWAPHRQAGEPGPAAPWPGGGLGERGWAGKRCPGLPRAQLAEEASTEPLPPPPREEPLRLEPPAPPQPRAETDRSADLRLLILTAGNKQCAGAGGWDST